MITGEQLLAQLQALPPEDRKLPVLGRQRFEWSLVPARRGVARATVVQDGPDDFRANYLDDYRDPDETYTDALVIE